MSELLWAHSQFIYLNWFEELMVVGTTVGMLTATRGNYFVVPSESIDILFEDEGQALATAGSFPSTRAFTPKAPVVNYNDPAQMPPHKAPETKQTSMEVLEAGTFGNIWVRMRPEGTSPPPFTAGPADQIRRMTGRDSVDFTLEQVQELQRIAQSDPPTVAVALGVHIDPMPICLQLSFRLDDGLAALLGWIFVPHLRPSADASPLGTNDQS